MQNKYNRVIIKISGEALSGGSGHGIDADTVEFVGKQIKAVVDRGVQVGIIVGGGNFWRGKGALHVERSTADQMGMLATIMNALALKDGFCALGMDTVVQTSIDMLRIAEPYNYSSAVKHLNDGQVVIFAGGTGCPYFSTDTGAALKAAEVHADVLLLAKNVDGVYDSDPKKNPAAKKYDEISYKQILSEGLQALDITATAMCMENDIPVLVFALNQENSIVDAVSGLKKFTGTIIH